MTKEILVSTQNYILKCIQKLTWFGNDEHIQGERSTVHSDLEMDSRQSSHVGSIT